MRRRRYSNGGGGCMWWSWLVCAAVVSALGVCGPSLYWRFNNAVVTVTPSCPPCICHCPPPNFRPPYPGLANLSVSDCGGNDPDLKLEMEKQFVDLLSEEINLEEAVRKVHTQHMNITLDIAKRVASQYQKEAHKCIAATETCEQAREHAEAMLIKERKMTLLWEQRAHQMTWWEGE